MLETAVFKTVVEPLGRNRDLLAIPAAIIADSPDSEGVTRQGQVTSGRSFVNAPKS